ncbi:FliH/SctL family protein [Clostridium algidicarnis]|uniref:FliH/SctL family protein n=1 Tax=Clostridium algidicarnis TaxID=37659 RepID=UPI003FD895B8
MPSFYKVIKGKEVKDTGEKLIDTVHDIVSDENQISEDYDNRSVDSYALIGKSIMEKAKRKKEEIIASAYEDAIVIEKDAYEKAYKEGYEKGYAESYEAHIEKALKEADSILEEGRNSAGEIVKSAKENFESYLNEKRDEILNLSYEIAKTILKREIVKEDGLDDIILKILKEHRDNKSFIIRCEEGYVDHIRENIVKWKDESAFKGDIFVIKDDSLGEGNAVIEKDNGSITVGIDIGLENIKKSLY